MTILQVSEVQGQLVVDSRLIAEELGIKHKTFLETLRNHEYEIEEAFGTIFSETASVVNSVGAVNNITFAYLTEDQAHYVMTLSRNTDKVRLAKRNIVKAFSLAKKKLQETSTLDSDLLHAVMQRLDNMERKAAVGAEHESFMSRQSVENPGLVALIEGAKSTKSLPPVKVWFTVSEWAKSKGYSLDIRQKQILSAQAAALYKNFKCKNPNISESGSYIFSNFEEYILDHAMHTTFNVTYGLEKEIQGLEPMNIFDICTECGVYINPDNELVKSLVIELVRSAIRAEELPRSCQYSSRAFYPIQLLKDFITAKCIKFGGRNV